MNHPPTSLMSPEFKWTPPASTNVQETWKRYGWRPMTEAERQAAQAPSKVLRMAKRKKA